ncbi:MAG TPA: prolipoprotein diacylglyceryl transferase [Candidatus Limnocylindria bacterium]|nr:prolipoprotein diacylglyceryl transferase [Candidatus Limnocylindria bacterium]
MDINLDPNLRLGPIAIAWHGIFTAVGIFFGVALPVRLLRGKVSEEDAYSIATWGVVGGIVGARLFHVLDTWSYYAEHPEQILFIWSGGIAVWGGVVGGVVGGLIAGIRRKVPIGLTADGAAPGIALGLAIGRIGDVINGEHHAVACEPPSGICVTYSHPETLGQGPLFIGDRRFAEGPVHLAVGYDMIWLGAIILLALWLWSRRERGRPPSLPAGAIFWLFVLLYGLDRFVISFLRVGEPTSLLALRQDQLIGLIAMVVALPALLFLVLRRRPPAPAEATAA